MANTILVLALLLAVLGGYMHLRERHHRRQAPVSVTVVEWGIPVQSTTKCTTREVNGLTYIDCGPNN
jgi:hypothetical protein